jgi:hypothetical protein
MLPTTISFDSSAKISMGSMVKTLAGQHKAQLLFRVVF